MSDKFDEESKQQIEKDRRWIEFIKGDGWQEAKKRMFDKLMEVDSINAIPIEEYQGEDLIKEIQTRRAAISLIIEWISELEGDAERAEDNLELLMDRRKDEEIFHYEK